MQSHAEVRIRSAGGQVVEELDISACGDDIEQLQGILVASAQSVVTIVVFPRFVGAVDVGAAVEKSIEDFLVMSEISGDVVSWRLSMYLLKLLRTCCKILCPSALTS